MSQDISQQKDWLSAWKIFYEPEESLEKVDPKNLSSKKKVKKSIKKDKAFLISSVSI